MQGNGGGEGLRDDERLNPYESAEGGVNLYQAPREEPGAPGAAEPLTVTDDEGVETLRLPKAGRDPVGEIRLEMAAQEGGGQVFAGRRQRDVVRNLMTQFGTRADYVTFFPSRVFMRYVGPRLAPLNSALEELKARHPDALASGLFEALHERDSALRREVQAIRELLAQTVDYCERGFEGDYDKAVAMDFLEAVPVAADRRSAPSWKDHFAEDREALARDGVLTDLGLREGICAFKPCTFFGRFLADLTVVANEWMKRAENNAAQNVLSGGAAMGTFFERLDDVMAEVARGLDRVTKLAQREVRAAPEGGPEGAA